MSEKPKILTPEEVRARDLSELPEFLSDIEELVKQLNVLKHGTHIRQVVLQPYDVPENYYRTYFTHKVAHIKFELAEGYYSLTIISGGRKMWEPADFAEYIFSWI